MKARLKTKLNNVNTLTTLFVNIILLIPVFGLTNPQFGRIFRLYALFTLIALNILYLFNKKTIYIFVIAIFNSIFITGLIKNETEGSAIGYLSILFLMNILLVVWAIIECIKLLRTPEESSWKTP